MNFYFTFGQFTLEKEYKIYEFARFMDRSKFIYVWNRMNTKLL